MVAEVANRAAGEPLIAFAQAQGLRWETWEQVSGRVRDIRHSDEPVLGALGVHASAELDRLQRLMWRDELREVVDEFCATACSALWRAESLPAASRDGVQRQIASFCQFIRAWRTTYSDDFFGLHGKVVALNAGLSRFASQVFSGTPPIVHKECHYWTHSLLGIGSAWLGLSRLVAFVSSSIEGARIPERLAALGDMTSVGDVAIEDLDLEPLVDLLPFFSGRDGWRADAPLISAPLAAVAGCNNARWALQTLTHEISHVVVRQALDQLIPPLGDLAGLRNALDALSSERPPEDRLEKYRSDVVFTALLLEQKSRGLALEQAADSDAGEVTESALVDYAQQALVRWERELDETITATFDFLYFYGSGKHRKYVQGIWKTWGVIPNVRPRLREYLVRTICAVWASSRRLDNGVEIAKDRVLEALRPLGRLKAGAHAAEAVKVLEESWDSDIRDMVEDRQHLVDLAHNALFSSTIAKSLLTGQPDPSVFELNELPNGFGTNPMTFSDQFSRGRSPSQTHSAWIYLVLAFSMNRDA